MAKAPKVQEPQDIKVTRHETTEFVRLETSEAIEG